MKNITHMLGGVFIATLALWGPGITLASAVVVAGVDIPRADVIQGLSGDPELQAEVGNLMDRLEEGDPEAEKEIGDFIETIQNEEAAPAEEGEGTPAEGEGTLVEGEGTLEGEGVTTEATETQEVQAPEESSAADTVAEENSDKTITWSDGTVHPADEPEPGS